MRLLKMHGIGNDYIYADCMDRRALAEIGDAAELAVRISDRHFGVGGDGLIMICPSDNADCFMRMYNNDGSEGSMCGNGIRCVSKYMYDNGYVEGDSVSIETLSGIKQIRPVIDGESGVCTGATVDMGKAEIEEKKVKLPDGTVLDTVCVDVGNPHCIIFVDDADSTDPSEKGPGIEKDPMFPNRTNVEFVTVTGRDRIRMRVWERGTGITMACGTGATATGAAAMHLGLCGDEVTVILDGGELVIRRDPVSGHMFMTGPASYVFDIENYDLSGNDPNGSAGSKKAKRVFKRQVRKNGKDQ